jgi:hypothetical protein
MAVVDVASLSVPECHLRLPVFATQASRTCRRRTASGIATVAWERSARQPEQVHMIVPAST